MDLETEGSEKTTGQGRSGLALLSGSWLAGFGALAMFTAPSQSADPVYLPATVATANIVRAAGEPDEAVIASVDFIVKFEGSPEAQNCMETFRADPDEGRTMFRNWADAHTVLDRMQLKKVSYSDEMILSWSTETGQRPNRADIIAKQRALQAMPLIKYADPDYTAHIGDTSK